MALSAELEKRMHLGNTSIYRSQQGVISDTPVSPFERVGDVPRFSFFINSTFSQTLDRRTPETTTYWGMCYALPKNKKNASLTNCAVNIVD